MKGRDGVQVEAGAGDSLSKHPQLNGAARFRLRSVTRRFVVFGLPYYAASPCWPLIRAKAIRYTYDPDDVRVLYFRVAHDLVIEARCPYLSGSRAAITPVAAAQLARLLYA